MILTVLFVFLFACIIAVVFSINALITTLRFGLPFVGTPRWAVRWLGEHLELTDRDVVYELGSGDARVLAELARRHPTTKFVGIEVQWWPALLARWRCRNVKNIRLIRGDLFPMDLSAATITYGFYIAGFTAKLVAKLQANLRPGTRVISYGFTMPGWQTTQEIADPRGKTKSRLLFYQR